MSDAGKTRRRKPPPETFTVEIAMKRAGVGPRVTFPGQDLPRVEVDEAPARCAPGYRFMESSVGENLLGKAENMRIW